MNHLPRPHNGLKPFNVPYLCSEERLCTSEGFKSWPEINDLSLSDFSQDLGKVVAKLQAWLYFGLIAIFTEDASREGWYKFDSSTQTSSLDTSKLRNSLKTKVPSREISGDDNLELGLPLSRYDLANESLEQAITTMNEFVIPLLQTEEFCERARGKTLWTSHLHAVIFAIDVLIDVVKENLPSTIDRSCLVSNVSLFAHSIHESGRCHSLTSRFQPSSSTWYYLIHLPKTERHIDHTACSLDCVHNRVNSKVMKPHHRKECPRQYCRPIAVPDDIIATHIKNGGLPLISLSEQSSGSMKMDVIEGRDSYDYTAISHVWAGGLGNSEENSLPLCQLQYLRTTLNGFSDSRKEWLNGWITDKLAWSKPTIFWLDTLCIPVHSKYYDLKIKSINNMARIYAGAGRVIVLDSELENFSVTEMREDVTNVLALIKCSPWMSRSWTLQEGTLSLTVLLRFKDMAKDLKALLISANKDECRIAHELMSHNAMPFLHLEDTQIPEDLQPFNMYQFITIWNSLLKRNTMMPSDVPGMFATLLNLQPEEIMNLPPVHRMRKIVRSQRMVPISLLFMNTEKSWSTDDDLFTIWNPPIPIIGSSASTLKTYEAGMNVTDEGLLLDCRPQETQVYLCTSDSKVQEKVLLKSSRGNLYIHVKYASKLVDDLELPVKLGFILSNIHSSDTGKRAGAVVIISQNMKTKENSTKVMTSWEGTVEWSYNNLMEIYRDDDYKEFTAENLVPSDLNILVDIGKYSLL